MVMRRRGFTLIEMMLATVVTAVLSVSLATLFVGIRRLVRQAYDDASLSLALRAERERALFNAVAEGGSVHWGGLLSAKDTRCRAATRSPSRRPASRRRAARRRRAPSNGGRARRSTTTRRPCAARRRSTR